METSNYIPNENNSDNKFILFFSLLFVLIFIVFCPPVFGNEGKTNDEKCIDNSLGLSNCMSIQKRADIVAKKYAMMVNAMNINHKENMTSIDIPARYTGYKLCLIYKTYNQLTRNSEKKVKLNGYSSSSEESEIKSIYKQKAYISDGFAPLSIFSLNF